MKKSHLFAQKIADLGRTEKSGLGLSYALSSMVDNFITKTWSASEDPDVAMLLFWPLEDTDVRRWRLFPI